MGGEGGGMPEQRDERKGVMRRTGDRPEDVLADEGLVATLVRVLKDAE